MQNAVAQNGKWILHLVYLYPEFRRFPANDYDILAPSLCMAARLNLFCNQK